MFRLQIISYLNGGPIDVDCFRKNRVFLCIEGCVIFMWPRAGRRNCAHIYGVRIFCNNFFYIANIRMTEAYYSNYRNDVNMYSDHVLYKETNFLINKRYRIRNVLGKGSYGTVCAAIELPIQTARLSWQLRKSPTSLPRRYY